jgi:hypothetical protein
MILFPSDSLRPNANFIILLKVYRLAIFLEVIA